MALIYLPGPGKHASTTARLLPQAPPPPDWSLGLGSGLGHSMQPGWAHLCPLPLIFLADIMKVLVTFVVLAALISCCARWAGSRQRAAAPRAVWLLSICNLHTGAASQGSPSCSSRRSVDSTGPHLSLRRSRPVDTEKAAAAGTASATNTTAPPKPAAVTPKRACSWFGKTCADKQYTIHCRCRNGCRYTLQFQLHKHTSNFSYCSNGVYNKGDWCTRTASLKFNGQVTYSALVSWALLSVLQVVQQLRCTRILSPCTRAVPTRRVYRPAGLLLHQRQEALHKGQHDIHVQVLIRRRPARPASATRAMPAAKPALPCGSYPPLPAPACPSTS